MEPQGQDNQVATNEAVDSSAKAVLKRDGDNNQDEVILELASKLQDHNFFNLQLINEYGVEPLSCALSLCWESWDESTRMIIASHLINAYRTKNEFSKGVTIPALRVGVAVKIMDVDPPNALRILASIALQGAKPFKAGSTNSELCKAIQNHLLQESEEALPRYTKLYVKDRAEETKVLTMHLVSTLFGPNCDLRDPILSRRQFQLLKSLLENDLFPCDDRSIVAITKGVSAWPIKMRPDAAQLWQLFSERHWNTENVFEPIIRSSAVPGEDAQRPVIQPPLVPCAPTASRAGQAAEAAEPVEKTSEADEPLHDAVGQPAVVPSSRELNTLDPMEVVKIGAECFQRLGDELERKRREVKELRLGTLEASNKHRDEERNYRKRLEEHRETIAALREEVLSLKSEIRANDLRMSAMLEDKAGLEKELESSRKEITELEEAHQKNAKKLSEAIGSVSDHKVSEFKRSLELELRNDYEELVHLQGINDCSFHMHALKGIFRKLGQKGIFFGEVVQ